MSDTCDEDDPFSGVRVVLDPGHSPEKPGARGLPPDVPQEHELNQLQCDWICQRLGELGVAVEVPGGDDLEAIGRRAHGAAAFVSLHHNAHDRIDHHTFACVASYRASVGSIELAADIAKRVGAALSMRLRCDAGCLPGVVHQELAVLRAAELTDCQACVLVESYFIDHYGSLRLCEKRSLIAADAIADAILAWLAPRVAAGLI
jgi:N-acetylmuramoyl-L-alanine amidase